MHGAFVLIFTLIACQEPFAVDRHDLVGDRVAAIELREEPGGLRPRLALFHDGRPWTDALPTLSWSFVSDDDDAAWALPGGAAGTGPHPLLEPTDERLLLVAEWPSGTSRHVVDLGAEAALPSLGEVGLATVTPPPAVQDDVSMEARMGWNAQSAAAIAPGGVAELRAESDGTVRWMSTQGDFLELDRNTTHWWPGAFSRDDDILEYVEPGREGVVTVVAAAVAEGVRFAAADVVIGPLPIGGFTTSGRFVPTDSDPPSGRVQGMLEADDTAASGLRLAVLGAVGETVDPGTSTLCDGSLDGPFDPTWLLEGRCLRSEVLGATVVVEFQ